MIFLFALLVMVILFLAYYLMFFRLYFHKHTIKQEQKDFPPVSIVIAVQNAEYLIEKNLPAFLEQDYPTYEVVVVNDFSTDRTLEILSWLASQHSNLKVVDISNGVLLYPGKKFALSVGIKEAKYEHLVFSDIDCKPASKHWLQHIISQYTPSTEIVLGYGTYEKNKSLFNYFVRVDAFQIGLLYLSAAKIGLPYMATGRNLSYKKSLFYKHNGFSKHLHLASGDDDLFIQQAARKKNTSVCIHPEAFTISFSPPSWKRWFNQKSRHYTTSDHYSLWSILYPGIYSLLQIFFPFVLVLSIFDSSNDVYYLGASILLGFIKWVSQWVVFGLISKKWKENIHAYIFPLAEFLLLILLFIPYMRRKKFTRQWI
jgi:glycosyltransferase involved in cell wall biosynthesis